MLKTLKLKPAVSEYTNVAETPEARLIAEVIRQAVEDYAYTETAVAGHKQRKWARHLIRKQRAAARFLDTEELNEFLAHFDVEHFFNPDAIRRGVRKLYGMDEPVEHAPAHGVIPEFAPTCREITHGQIPKYGVGLV